MTAEATRDRKPTVLYVAVPSALGGSNRALVTLLGALGERVSPIVAGPGEGALKRTLTGRGLVEDYLDLPRYRRMGRLGRMAGAARILRWVFRHRRTLDAIHANATTGFNLSAPAAILTRVPLVVWVHDSVSTPWGRRLGPTLSRLIGRVRWLAVSPTAASVLVENRLCRPSDVRIIPNPIDPADVVTDHWQPADDGRVRIGFLGAATAAKGFDLLPEVISLSSDLPIRWKLFVTRREGPFESPIWARLATIDGVQIDNPGRSPDVRAAYAQCDVVFNPSRSESFSRVTAEARLNGLPVVASDIEPIRSLIGDFGVLFTPGRADEAAQAIRRVVRASETYRRRSSLDPSVGSQIDPQAVAREMLDAYMAG